MRSWLRQWCSEIWVVSLSPEGYRAPASTLVFEEVQHEVAVVCAARSPHTDDKAATVRYRGVTPGTRSAKFNELETIQIDNDSLQMWAECPDDWRAPFRPAGTDVWRSCLSIHDLLPWSASGLLAQRGWPTSPDPDTLNNRWNELIKEPDLDRKRILFKETNSRKTDRTFDANLPGCSKKAAATPISRETNSCPTPTRLAWRSFDRQWIIPDIRILDRPAPPLWKARSDLQIHLTCIQNDHPKNGPAVTITRLLPGLDHYHGRGGRAFPLWRDKTASTANVTPGLLAHLGTLFGTGVAPKDVFAYVAAVCAHPAYTAWLNDVSPHTPGLRVPVSADGDYWSMAVGIGRRVIWAHTFGECCIDAGDGRPAGRIRVDGGPLVRSETGEGTRNRTFTYSTEHRALRIGGGVFENVSPEVHGYEVSGTKVIGSWFNYRKSSKGTQDPDSLERITPAGWRPEWDIELLDILNALTVLVALEPEQAELLTAIVDGPQVTVDSLTSAGVLPVPPEAKKAPAVAKKSKPGQVTLI